MSYLLVLFVKIIESAIIKAICDRITQPARKVHAWHLRRRIKHNEKLIEKYKPAHVKATETAEIMLRKSGIQYCRRCGRVSGARYQARDGRQISVSLRKVSTNKGNAYLCGPCYSGIYEK